jgi:hypothetical protein
MSDPLAISAFFSNSSANTCEGESADGLDER